jgi:hypothetical protein
MALSEELKKLYASAGTDILLHTLSFNHPAWTSEFFIVRDWQDLTANLENSGPSTVFQKFAFSIQGPNKDENGNQYLQLNIDSVSLELIDLIEQASLDLTNSPIEVTYRAYLESDTTGPQNDPPLKLFMRKVEVDNTRVTGQAELISLENRKFPNVVYGTTFQSLVLAT